MQRGAGGGSGAGSQAPPIQGETGAGNPTEQIHTLVTSAPTLE